VRALGSYPKGAVTVNVQVYGSAGPYIVYVDGASAPQAVTACCGNSQRLTFPNVAVFAGHFQRVVAIFGFNRWFTPGIGAMVQPGQTVDAGTLVISGGGYRELGAANVSWRSDSTALVYRFSECCYDKIAAHPAEEDVGVTTVQPAGFAKLVDYAPVPEKANQLLYTSADVLNGNQIVLGTEGSNSGQTLVSTPVLYQTIRDLRWLPDGSGFVYVEDGLDSDGLVVVNSNIYHYDFASQTTQAITQFASEFVGHVSVSPDGQQLVFEHSANDQAVDGLWLVNRDGSNMHVLVPGPDVGRPAWSHGALRLPSKRYVPLVKR
jgi:hypothetical protein